MPESSNPAGVIAALASASVTASGAVPAALTDDTRPLARAAAGEEMRTAQVELYCGHQGEALSAIRRAKRALEEVGSPSAFVGLASMEEAAWHARKNDTTAAVDLLGHAKDRLAR